MPVRRGIVAEPESSRQGLSQRPAPQRFAHSQSDRPPRSLAPPVRHATSITSPCVVDDEHVPHELDPNPDPSYDTRELYPPPIRPREPILFSPLKVPDALLGRKQRQIDVDEPATQDPRQPSVQCVVSDLPRGLKRKLGGDEADGTSKVLVRSENATGRLLPAFDEPPSPPRQDAAVRRPANAASTSYRRSPNHHRVASGAQWVPQDVSRPPPDQLPPSSRVRDHVPEDRPIAMYGRLQGYTREPSRAVPDRSRQFTRGTRRAFAREDDHYDPYKLPTRMDYLQPADGRRYWDDVDAQEYPPRYFDRLDYVDEDRDMARMESTSKHISCEHFTFMSRATNLVPG